MPYKTSDTWTDAKRDLRCPGIYIIKNLSNNDCYIGQAQDVWMRWRRHISELRGAKHSNRHLQRAYDLYGEDNFEFDVVCFCLDTDDLNKNETFFIGFYAQHGRPYPAYNNRPDAISIRGMPSPMRGKHYPKEDFEKRCAAQKNRSPWKFSDEELEKRRERWKNNHPYKNKDYVEKAVAARRVSGSYYTDERKAHQKALSEAKKIPIERVCQKGGDVVRYDSAVDAEKDGFSRSAINKMLKGKSKTSGGYFWRYAAVAEKMSESTSINSHS